MKENLNFYRCPICGNIVELIDGNMDRIICCGKPMIKMIANTYRCCGRKTCTCI